MNARHAGIAPTPLAACLAAAMGLNLVPAIAGSGVSLPMSGISSDGAEHTSLAGHAGPGGRRPFDALQADDADLVRSRVTHAGPVPQRRMQRHSDRMARVGGADRAVRARPSTSIDDLPRFHSLADGHITPAARVQGRNQASAANTIIVQNCNNSGPGSLRQAIDDSSDGDVIDMSALQCSTISLVGSGLSIFGNLTLQGPGADALTIQRGDTSVTDYARVIYGRADVVTDTLQINDLYIAHGHYGGIFKPTGGCIQSTASVTLRRSIVTLCDVDTTRSHYSDPTVVGGGGIYAKGTVKLYDSIVGSNVAICQLGHGYYYGALHCPKVIGGGVYAKYKVIASNSYIAFNSAKSKDNADDGALGGGLAAGFGGIGLFSSTVSHNVVFGHGTQSGGGLYSATGVVVSSSSITANTYNGVVASGYAHVYSSTINDNGSVGVRADDVLVRSSTITGHGSSDVEASSAVIDNSTISMVYSSNGGSMHSSIVDDVLAPSGVVFSGDHNIASSFNLYLPSDTMFTDPKLLPLTDNGGPTMTMGLADDSPARNAGANPDNLAYDQRGAGFPRLQGAAVDIGAFEAGPAKLVISPTTVEFGSVLVGDSASMTVTARNTGDHSVNLAVGVAGGWFLRSGGTCAFTPPIVIPAKAACTLVYAFVPQAKSEASQALTYTSDAANAGANGQIQLHGTGVGDVIFEDGFDP